MPKPRPTTMPACPPAPHTPHIQRMYSYGVTHTAASPHRSDKNDVGGGVNMSIVSPAARARASASVRPPHCRHTRLARARHCRLERKSGNHT